MSTQFKREVLTLKAQGYQGSTPYVFWGNYLLIGLSVFFLLILAFRKGRISPVEQGKIT